MFKIHIYLSTNLQPKSNLYEETISAICFVCVF